jgi:hypothetical protein
MCEALAVSQMAQNDPSTEVSPVHSWKSSGNSCKEGGALRNRLHKDIIRILYGYYIFFLHRHKKYYFFSF